MPNYRRNFVTGGCYFFTVNLLERRRTLLTDHIDLLRDSRPYGVLFVASSLDGACGIRAFEAPMSRIPRCYIRATKITNL